MVKSSSAVFYSIFFFKLLRTLHDRQRPQATRYIEGEEQEREEKQKGGERRRKEEEEKKKRSEKKKRRERKNMKRRLE